MADLMSVPHDSLSLQQWDALELDNTRRWELAEGNLVMSPRPSPHHSNAAARLRELLNAALPDDWIAVVEIDMAVDPRTPATVRSPDLVVIPTALYEKNPPRVDAGDVLLSVEIVSPGSRRTDRIVKLREYADAGIEHYWLVDLDAPSGDGFVAYRLRGDGYRVVSRDVDGCARVADPCTAEFTVRGLTAR